MNKPEETVEINRCLAIIEKKLSWGSSDKWSNFDFEKLSETVLSNTGVRLSSTTLKRVWGRLKYDHAPTTTTLNTLARYAGYESWREFANNNSNSPGPLHQSPAPLFEERRQDIPTMKVQRRIMSLIVFVVMLSIVLSLIYQKGTNLTTNNGPLSRFMFRADKVMSEGVPNSVVFTYDAANAKSDSVFIIQTWDARRKTLVPKNQHYHSAIYYYPGYFRTKLLVDGEVVKTHDLHITTNGWLGLVDNGEKPYYFDKKDIIKADWVEINEALLSANHFELKPSIPKIRFFNEGNISGIRNDNFEFETTLRNNYKDSGNACQNVEVLIQCVDDIIIIPLVSTACTGDARLYIPGKEFVSKYADLRGFGTGLANWTTLKVVCKNKKMQFFVNKKKAFESVFTHKPAAIVGLQYRFNGAGLVKGTWLSDGKNHVVKF
jgi:hypothetical protein